MTLRARLSIIAWLALASAAWHFGLPGAWGELASTSNPAPGGACGGDLAGSYPNCTVAKVNGNSVPSGAAAHQVAVATAASATAWKTIPDCTDSAGNHLNYTQSGDAFSCGTSGGAPSGSAGGDLGGTYPNPTVAQATGIFTFKSGAILKVRTVIAAGDITAATNDIVICVNKTSGAATAVNLFATPTTGSLLVVKDCKGDAASNNITVTPAAGNIDGAGTFVINSNYGVWRGVYTGAAWSTI